MATNFFKIKSGIRIIPTSAPASPQEGDIYSDSTADIIYVYLDAAWREFLTDDQVQTISGKTFAQGLVFSAHNTHDIGTTGTRPKDLFLSGTADIDGNADVAGTATIGTLSVTGDATVTGNLTVNGTTTTLNTATLDVEDKNISVNKGGTTAGAEGSGLTVLGDSNASIAEVLYDSALASKFKAGVTGAEAQIATVSHTQTLTNKTIDADSNTITNIENADIKALAAIDATKIADGSVTNTEFQYIGGLTSDAQTQLNAGVTALNNHMSDTTTHGTTGDIVGTSDTQTLTNKTLTTPSMSGPVVTNYTDIHEESSAPASPEPNYERMYHTAGNQMFVKNSGGATKEFTFATASQTLTNKTIVAANNTITTAASGNLAATELNAALAELQGDIDTKGSDLTTHMSDTTTHGTTGDIVGTSDTQTLSNKTLLDTTTAIKNASGTGLIKFNGAGVSDGQTVTLTTPTNSGAATLVGTSQTQTLTNKTLVVASNTVTTAASGNLAATELNAALSELQTDIDTRATSSALTTHTGASSGVHGVTGSVVGTSDTQTLTNKTLTAPLFDTYEELTQQVSGPGAPGTSGRSRLYFKTDGKLYKHNFGSSEVEVGAGGGGGISAWVTGTAYAAGDLVKYGNKPYIAIDSSFTSGATFEADLYHATTPKWAPFESTEKENLIANTAGGTTGWDTYDDSAETSDDSKPFNGTGTAPSSGDVSTVFASDLQVGKGKIIQLTKTAATNQQGKGWSYDFSIPDEGMAHVHTVSFMYKVASGTYADGVVKVYLYDKTNSTLIEPAPTQILNVSGSAYAEFKATFQTSATGQAYRLIFHIASSATAAFTLNVVDLEVRQQSVAYGAPVTDLQSFTPTLVNVSGTARGFWKREGDSAIFDVAIVSPTVTGTIQFTLPFGWQADKTKMSGYGNGSNGDFSLAGICFAEDGSPTNMYTGYPEMNNTSTTVQFFSSYGTGGKTGWNASSPISWTTNDVLRFRVTLPILGWGSSVLMSDSADTRVVALEASGTTTGTLNGSFNNLTYVTVKDTHNAYSGGVYTIPVSGFYAITATNSTNDNITAPTAINLGIYVDGVQQTMNAVFGTYAGAFTYNVTTTLSSKWLNAGQQVTIKVQHESGSGSHRSSGNLLTIVRQSGPAQIAQSERVAIHYNTGSGTLDASYNPTTFTNKIIDTHGAYSGGIFTAPRAGIYSIAVGVRITSTVGALADVNVKVTKAGSDFLFSGLRVLSSSGTYPVSLPLSAPAVYLTAGEQIRVYCYTDGTGGTYTSASANWISILG